MKLYNSVIPVIDLFAGPGGLAEGFSSYCSNEKKVFNVCLSIEKDPYAHRTLELRSFFRQFPSNDVPDAYYEYLRKEISRDQLFNKFIKEASAAKNEALHAELGSDNFPSEKIDEKIFKALGNTKRWILIGGPPCQAYSTVGRSRNKGIEGYVPEKDNRHFLYQEYLRIISKHWPSLFVMENVKGLLSAKVNGGKIFDHILQDLHNPLSALENINSYENNEKRYKYKIYSLVNQTSFPFDNSQSTFSPSDFLIQSENFGIPQTRHRLILLGIREDLWGLLPKNLTPHKQISANQVLEGLPKIRSGLSRESDTRETWDKRLSEIIEGHLFNEINDQVDQEVWDCICVALGGLDVSKKYERGGEFVRYNATCKYRREWFLDSKLKGVCNHISKAHMPSDLHRYMYASCFAEVYERSPTLPEFPRKLWPAHKNVHKAKRSGNFSDRFRVQLESKPATTIMSHISKDGHYYIHYDPAQCRSLTVREAARLQTFPDNYFFEGPRTEQYSQVGNAVPPLLAAQIAEVVYDIAKRA
ncbi:MAG TPA: DNA cytosine methyltransferase [Rikenellaceae bacterium]|nr:DNA cytosine methyltransferase [Rikenellaceae bacterium]